jgi:hypothetical protein
VRFHRQEFFDHRKVTIDVITGDAGAEAAASRKCDGKEKLIGELAAYCCIRTKEMF